MLKEDSPTKLKYILGSLLCLGCLFPSLQILSGRLETLLSTQSKWRREIYSLSVSLAMPVTLLEKGPGLSCSLWYPPQVLAHAAYSVKVWRMNN